MTAFIKLLQAAVLAAVIVGSPQALAGRGAVPSDAPQRTVRFGDLDIATPQGAAELYRRIQRAAHFVCNDVARTWDGRHTVNWIKCFNDTVEHAVLQVDRPTLLAIHRQRTKPAA